MFNVMASIVLNAKTGDVVRLHSEDSRTVEICCVSGLF